MNNYKKILFICNSDSTHAMSWINLLKDTGYDVRVFAVSFSNSEDRFLPDWEFPTYVMEVPRDISRIKSKLFVYYLSNFLPSSILQVLIDKFNLKEKWLKSILKNWKPDIIHSFPLNVGGKLAARTLKTIRKDLWPKWVASSWGSDLFLGIEGEKNEKENIKYILKNCDGFFADCNRDVNIAKENGIDRNNIKFSVSVPGTGGLDLKLFKKYRKLNNDRNILLIPKGYEREHANKIFPLIESLKQLDNDLLNYEIHILMVSDAVKKWLNKISFNKNIPVYMHKMIPQSDLFELLSRTKLMISLSLSDGTPNVMLEAMAAGALPIMHPLDSIKEWIKDGKNGILVHSLYPDKIREAILMGLENNKLYESAFSYNLKLIEEKADRKILKNKIIGHYEELF